MTKVLRHGKAVEKVEPPSVDISADAIFARVRWLRRDGGDDYQADPETADMIEALAAALARAEQVGYERGLAEGRALGITVIGA